MAGVLAGPSQVVTYDCRGFGESAPTPGQFSHLEDFFAVLNDVADSDDSDVWLVGSAMGGRIALAARARGASLSPPEALADTEARHAALLGAYHTRLNGRIC